MKVLIAEDDVTQLNRVKLYLQKWNYDLAECRDGIKAWEIIQSVDPPNILLLDWKMPGMSGISICRKVRKMENGGNFYIIMLTAKSTEESVSEGIEAGTDDFISKPFYPLDLKVRMRTAEKIIGLRRKLSKAENALREKGISID